jgi:cytochrome c
VFAYIADPRAFLRAFTGNPKAKAKMTFKLKDEQDRANVIAYLKSFE